MREGVFEGKDSTGRQWGAASFQYSLEDENTVLGDRSHVVFCFNFPQINLTKL